jgi:hypothetical protein
MAEPTSSKSFAPTLRGLLFLPLDSAEFASALKVAGAEETEFAREILDYMIEKNLSRNAEIEERREELGKVTRFPDRDSA